MDEEFEAWLDDKRHDDPLWIETRIGEGWEREDFRSYWSSLYD